MIEDLELREIYKTSSVEHLQKIEAGLLQLEKEPWNDHPLEELMREAHSLKGDSRIVGVEGAEIIAHCLEDVLGSLKRHEIVLSPQLSDRLYQGLDGMGKLINEAVTDIPSEVVIEDLVALLKDIASKPAPVSEKSTELDEEFKHIYQSGSIDNLPNLDNGLSQLNPQDSTSIEESLLEVTSIKEEPQNLEPATHKTSLEKVSNEPYHIDTIRVPTRHLDTLMTQTGELTVIKIRLAHLATQLEEIANLWEESQLKNNQTKIVKYQQKLDKAINQLKSTAEENSARMDLIAGELEEKIRTLRLLPLSNLFQLFPRMVRDISRGENKEIELIIEGGETVADKQILEEIKDPLMHLIRNAIDHGIETPQIREKEGKPKGGKIWLRGYQTATNLLIEVQDDGKGLDLEKIKQTALKRGLYRSEELETLTTSQLYNLVLEPGFSTRQFITEVSGRGIGLDVVRSNVEKLKGNIQIESSPGHGCTFRLQLGTSLATANVLLVEVQGIVYGLPLEFVQTTLLVESEQIFTIEGRQTLALNERAISVVKLSDLLQLPPSESKYKSIPCILLHIGDDTMGLFVDNVLDTQELVIKPQSKLLKRVKNVTGASILGTGDVCMILNPLDLLKTLQKRNSSGVVSNSSSLQPKAKPVLLLVEDSIATRTQEKRILEGAGYEVIIAVDGLDGFNKLRTRRVDAVISDVQMPNLDGLGLTARIRQLPEFKELPIILVTSLSSDEDKRRGAEAGANAYIVKTQFNQELLLDALRRLI